MENTLETFAQVPKSKENPNINIVGSGNPLLVRTMIVTATYAQLVALSNFMNENCITFEKIENGTV